MSLRRKSALDISVQMLGGMCVLDIGSTSDEAAVHRKVLDDERLAVEARQLLLGDAEEDERSLVAKELLDRVCRLVKISTCWMSWNDAQESTAPRGDQCASS